MTSTRMERSLARMLLFVAGVHALLGFVLFAMSGRWVSNDTQAVLAMLGLLWSVEMGFTALIAGLVLADRRRRR